jgi:hypothetical protein
MAIAFAIALGALAGRPAVAQNATWLASPPSNNWDTATNWNPAAVPTNTAMFDTSLTTSLIFSAGTTSINTIQFTNTAPAYTFKLKGLTQ